MFSPLPHTLFLLTLFALSGSVRAQDRQIRQLADNIDRLEAYLDQRDVLAPKVSAVPVAWHLDHMLKVVKSIHGSLAASDPADYRYKFKPTRTLVFTMGRFPRGVAESPKSVRPPDTITTTAIREQLAEVRALLPTFAGMDKRQHFTHFTFGPLNRRRTVKFINIHTRHHLRIVEDILLAVND